jgi:predicted lipid-binding transport protein (Tim44 family)
MNSYVDILIFAVIAVVLLWRLRATFGERSEDEPAPRDKPFIVIKTAKDDEEARQIVEQIVQQQKPLAVSPVNWATNLPNYDMVTTATAHHRLTPFVKVDPEFRPDDFIDKAKKAFVMIVNAYTSGNKKTLEFLLAPPLYTVFAQQIDARAQGDVYKAELHGIRAAKISDATLNGTLATVTVDFTAEQTITYKRADGTIVGDNDGTRQVNRDRWTFLRDLAGDDPKWLLQRTEEVD